MRDLATTATTAATASSRAPSMAMFEDVDEVADEARHEENERMQALPKTIWCLTASPRKPSMWPVRCPVPLSPSLTPCGCVQVSSSLSPPAPSWALLASYSQGGLAGPDTCICCTIWAPVVLHPTSPTTTPSAPTRETHPTTFFIVAWCQSRICQTMRSPLVTTITDLFQVARA